MTLCVRGKGSLTWNQIWLELQWDPSWALLWLMVIMTHQWTCSRIQWQLVTKLGITPNSFSSIRNLLIFQINLKWFELIWNISKFAYISFETDSNIAENSIFLVRACLAVKAVGIFCLQLYKCENEIWELLLDQPAVNLVFWLLIGKGGRPPLARHFTCLSQS